MFKPHAMSSEISHLTLLRPRTSAAAESIPYDAAFIRTSLEIDREKWRDRKDFFCTTLSFCLSLANLWRFPRQAFLCGQGAFVMLYIIFTILFGSSLLFFEVALGQYSTKGFTRVFAACPLFEGVSYSMLCYCAIASVMYNFINVASFVYIYASLRRELQYAKCMEPACGNSSNFSYAPEYQFYVNQVWMLQGKAKYVPDTNWRNIGILFFLWFLIGIAIVAGIRTTPWPYLLHCPTCYIILIATFIMTMLMKGSAAGIAKFFIPQTKDIYNIQTWAASFEQMVVTLGLGMGPLINFASYLNFQSPVHKDTAMLCFFVLVSSLLSGMIFFGSMGAVAYEKNVAIDDIFKPDDKDILYPHVIFSCVFSMMTNGMAQFMSVTFFLMLFLTGWFSLISYTETVAAGIYASGFLKYGYKITFNIGICILLFLMGICTETIGKIRGFIFYSEYFLGTAVLLILLVELVSIIYIYGIFEFCDEIEFMLGFYPNYYYQISWVFGPVILLLLLIYFSYAIFSAKVIDWIQMGLIIVCIIGPVFCRALYNVYEFHRRGVLSQIISPRLGTLDSSSDFDTF